MATGDGPKWLDPGSRTSSASEGGWQSVLKSGLVSSITLVIGFLLGTLTEWQKEASAVEKLYLEQRIKVFVQTGEHFEAYRLNWSRMTDFALWEWELLKKRETLSADDKKRKEGYRTDRDSSKDRLFADFRAARLFYSDGVNRRIEEFVAFDANLDQKTVDKLPPISAWNDHQTLILEAMRAEVRKK
jgi:hypothetical protein